MQDTQSTTQLNDAVLVHTVLSYLASNLSTADPRTAQAFGIRSAQTRRIMDLTTSDMMQIASKGAHCIRIEIDADAFDGVLATIDQTSSDIALKHACIRHDASREMMTALFDVTNREYAGLRQMLGMGRGNGRPKECRPEDAERIYDTWQRQGGGRDASSLLSLAKEVDQPLRVIWDELAKYDNLNTQVA